MDYELALCAQTDPALFFPEGHTLQEDTRKAKEICASCPLMHQCLEEALYAKVRNADGYESFVVGIWGGTTAEERRQIRRKRGIV